jgi:hypothetical protein
MIGMTIVGVMMAILVLVVAIVLVVALIDSIVERNYFGVAYSVFFIVWIYGTILMMLGI